MESETQDRKTSFLKKNITVFFGTMICCALWGSAFPCVKIGMRMLSIGSSDTADQFLFAGSRFTLAGFLVVVIGSLLEKKLLVPRSGRQLKKIGILSIFQTIGQYSLYYIGIAHTSGVNTSIVDSLSYFLAILNAALLFRMEKLTGKKIAGCLLGFAGVVLVNLSGSGLDFHMTFLGEGMVFLSAVSYSFSSTFAKKFSTDDDPVLLSGWQFMAGGVVLMLLGLIGGARPKHFTPGMLVLFIYLALISTIAYTIWTVLLKYNDVSRVSIYGFMNPIFGVLLSALFLGETEGLGINYLAALLVISIGIALINAAPQRAKS